MAIQQIISISINLQGDGTSTVFKYTLASLFAASFSDANTRVIYFATIPTSISAFSSFGIPVTAVMNGGKMQLTFASAIPTGAQGQVTITLAFNSQ